jgi:urease accessory protein
MVHPASSSSQFHATLCSANQTGDIMSFNLTRRRSLFLFLSLASMAMPALAHPGTSHVHGFMDGFLHPLNGWDHILAFIAVGMWSAQQTRNARWCLPLLFLAVMATSAVLPQLGLGLPSLEAGVALSVALLGLMVANGFRFTLGVSMAVVTVFAIFHGYTHGMEVPADAGVIPFGAGFIAATALLQGCGILLGMAAEHVSAGRFIQITGSAIAMSGMVLLSATI